MGWPSTASFSFIFVGDQFLSHKGNCENPIKDPVPGFELVTSGSRVSYYKHYTRAPALNAQYLFVQSWYHLSVPVSRANVKKIFLIAAFSQILYRAIASFMVNQKYWNNCITRYGKIWTVLLWYWVHQFYLHALPTFDATFNLTTRTHFWRFHVKSVLQKQTASIGAI